MNIVDIRNFYVEHKIKPVAFFCEEEPTAKEQDYIYYTEEKEIDGIGCYFLLQYHIGTGEEKILYAESLGKGDLFAYTIRDRETVWIYLWSEEKGLVQRCLQLETGEEISCHAMASIGRMVDILVLTPECFLGYFEAGEEEQELFAQYEQCGGGKRAVFLYHPEDHTQYMVQDPLLIRLTPDKIHCYIHEGQLTLLLCDSNMDEERKRYLYQEQRSVWLGKSEANDSILKIPVSQLVYDITNGMRRLTTEMIFNVSIDGYIHYVGMDEEFIYYYTNFFPADVEKLCACSKKDGNISVLQQNDCRHRPENVFYRFDEHLKGYRITKHHESYTLEGVWNTAIRAEYPQKLGNFVTTLEDRYVITLFCQQGEEPMYFVHDIETGKVQSVMGQICVIDDVLIFYR